MITDNKENMLFAQIASQQLAALIIAFPAWEPQTHVDESISYAVMMMETLNKKYT